MDLTHKYYTKLHLLQLVLGSTFFFFTLIAMHITKVGFSTMVLHNSCVYTSLYFHVPERINYASLCLFRTNRLY